MRMNLRSWIVVGAALSLSGCSELMARRHARTGNGHFVEGDYAAAVKEYEASQALYPSIPVVQLNLGLACKQLMLPGSRAAEQSKIVDCALKAFKRLGDLEPNNPRGEQLYIQTLFDGERYEDLIAIYQAQLAKNEKDIGALNALISVYSHSDNWNKSLEYSMKKADITPDDAEAQYSVGVMIHNRLYQKGGADKAAYDPRPDPNVDPKKAEPKTPPPFTVGDIIGAQRVSLSELGLKYMDRAIAVRPKYFEAMVYAGLLQRQKAYAYLEMPVEWFAAITDAEVWKAKAKEVVPPAPAAPAAPPG
jgi:tetratricopeptide (TPR) repeat protein